MATDVDLPEVLREKLSEMHHAQRRVFMAELGLEEGLSAPHRIIAFQYAEHGNLCRAIREAGYPERSVQQVRWQLQNGGAQRVLRIGRQLLAEREAMSELKAEYVRKYIKSVLEFCPLDYFSPAPGGGWMIGEDGYKSLPHEVKRLVEHVEMRTVRTPEGLMSYLGVTFISKTQALKMAAQYTLTQTVEVKQGLSWDELHKMEEAPVPDPIAERLALPAPSTNGAH